MCKTQKRKIYLCTKQLWNLKFICMERVSKFLMKLVKFLINYVFLLIQQCDFIRPQSFSFDFSFCAEMFRLRISIRAYLGNILRVLQCLLTRNFAIPNSHTWWKWNIFVTMIILKYKSTGIRKNIGVLDIHGIESKITIR